MPNTGEDREIIHIQAPTTHKVFTAYIPCYEDWV